MGLHQSKFSGHHMSHKVDFQGWDSSSILLGSEKAREPPCRPGEADGISDPQDSLPAEVLATKEEKLSWTVTAE